MGWVTDKPYNVHQIHIFIATGLCLGLSTAVVGLRLLGRRLVGVKLWWDDCVAVLALLFSYGPNVLTIIGVTAGLGEHEVEVSKSKSKLIAVTIWIHSLFICVCFFLIITTIILLYVRIFQDQWRVRTSYALGGFAGLYCSTMLISLIFQCSPISFYWNKDNAAGHCIKQHHYYVATNAIGMFLVLSVFFLPLHLLWSLRTTRAKKCGLVLTFSVGACTCIASLLRFVYVFKFQYQDPSWTIAYPVLWSCVEVSLGVVSVCLPSLNPWFTIIFGTKGCGTVRMLAPFKFDDDSSNGSSRAATLDGAAPVSEGQAPSTINLPSSMISCTTLDDTSDVKY